MDEPVSKPRAHRPQLSQPFSARQHNSLKAPRRSPHNGLAGPGVGWRSRLGNHSDRASMNHVEPDTAATLILSTSAGCSRRQIRQNGCDKVLIVRHVFAGGINQTILDPSTSFVGRQTVAQRSGTSRCQVESRCLRA